MLRRSPFMADRRGAGAVEFALIAPVLILLYFGCTEMSVGYTISRKATAIAGSVNDLIARTRESETLSSEDVKQIFSVASSSMVPYSATPLTVTAMQIHVDGDGKATVDCAFGNAGAVAGTPVALPAGLTGLRDTYILKTQTSYRYSPFSGFVFPSAFDLGGVNWANPRYAERVKASGC